MKYWTVGVGLMFALLACIAYAYFHPIYLVRSLDLPKDEASVLRSFGLSEADRYGGVGIVPGKGKTEWYEVGFGRIVRLNSVFAGFEGSNRLWTVTSIYWESRTI